MTDIQATIKKLENSKSIKTVVVINSQQKIVYPEKPSNGAELKKLVEAVSPLVEKALLLVRNLDSSNDLTFLHFKSGKDEIMIAPGDDEILIAVSDMSRIDV